jgi:hypothetical protein
MFPSLKAGILTEDSLWLAVERVYLDKCGRFRAAKIVRRPSEHWQSLPKDYARQ